MGYQLKLTVIGVFMGKRVTDIVLAEIVKNSSSYFDVLRNLGLKLAGGSHTHYKKRIETLKLDTSHFKGKGHGKGKLFTSVKREPSSILILRESGIRQRTAYLIEALLSVGVPHECNKCGQDTSWLGNPLTLDVDHINRNWLDDRAENLRFLCPNCHSQFSRKLIK